MLIVFSKDFLKILLLIAKMMKISLAHSWAEEIKMEEVDLVWEWEWDSENHFLMMTFLSLLGLEIHRLDLNLV
jgi:hypothetical protein